MVSWRFWSGVLCLAAVFAACSGKSENEKDDVAVDASGGAAGESSTAQTTGAAGDPGVTGTIGSATVTGFGPTAVSGTSGSVTTGGLPTGSFTTAATASSSGSTTGGVDLPANWSCSVLAYSNGVCDCGCGTYDPDCADHDLDTCEVCNTFGSCNPGACPGKIDEGDTYRCVPPPAGWTCAESAYHDGSVCNCGCGALDPDCATDDPSECNTCNSVGSCSASNCPGSIDEADNTICDLPEGWACPEHTYGNNLCDCGCGVVDRDCDSASRDACVICNNGCSRESCPGPIDEADNTLCTGVPYNWSCADRFFGDGSICNCGCGALDPDCASADADACDRCDFEGSCSRRDCPGTIDQDNNAYCEQPTPPAGWTCAAYYYGDGRNCDCGCGTLDIDCRVNDIEECTNCSGCGTYQCPGRVDPDDVRQCIPLPERWTCSQYNYGDGNYCDCGCGAPDPDCESDLREACNNCSPYGGSCVDDYDCKGLDPEDNSRCTDSAPAEWTCDFTTYNDGACDCGCGVRDLDCDDGDSETCDFCNLEGSCSEDNCPGSIDPDDNAVCTE